MKTKINIALIGYGYWGSILNNSLKSIGYNDILICDPASNDDKIIKDYKNINCKNVFVCVPAHLHYKICSHFLESGTNVFCEKPLATSFFEVCHLYKIAKKNNVKLFVDWIFTFNDHVNFIKKIYDSKQYGNLLSVTMNRLNMGPERKDVNAKYDLSSHDISIMLHVLDREPSKTFWVNYKRNKNSIKNDSAIGLLDFDGTLVQINSSWYYGKKDRDCIFEFENGFLYWDDINKTIEINNQALEVEHNPPLINSIKSFFCTDFNLQKQEEMTKSISKILEHDSPF